MWEHLGSILLAVVAITNLITAVIAWRTKMMADSTNTQMKVLEQNTNSIKDALIASTAKASKAEGKAEGKQEGEDKAADLVLATAATNAAATTAAAAATTAAAAAAVAGEKIQSDARKVLGLGPRES